MRAREAPLWVRAVGMAIWVTDPRGRISYFNGRAEEMLGITAHDALLRRCHEVIGGVDSTGRPFCGPQCSLVCAARQGGEMLPVELTISRPGRRSTTIQVIAIPARTSRSGRPPIIHCAQPVTPARRVTEFVGRVASRTAGSESTSAGADLTKREWEILELLAADETLYAIAARLHVSHATVRNHVQHILRKMGAHSTMEAVARHLLQGSC